MINGESADGKMNRLFEKTSRRFNKFQYQHIIFDIFSTTYIVIHKTFGRVSLINLFKVEWKDHRE